MIKNIILRTIVTFMMPIILLYGLYIQVHGDYSPGGGFQAGVIIASVIILYTMVFGINSVFRIMSISNIRLIGAIGVLMYIVTGIITMCFGSRFLSYSVLLSDSLAAQQLGIFIVELGVGMAVCSSMISIYLSFVSRKK
ncbi:Na(+)/H(+) antiporter subunit B [Neoehrlichia mikurensis]|uniref:Na(+)/H(+) antiporter subunit B n=1 Tax=Neoehrlichia mikurensis TaxID=89586 RepID=A0A9Q9BYQ5_9RICK|nr:Na(+)/H(+) antiporter subunit B [Neoehrlichia mikurensis]QXK91840.1 Na(+)/H(+) antiporter subunit B [Neoehrlichia mikurensis]QXK93053.1 Na(+)/H(+) antiporter subunit B [Neoehrlichia mikurensis]QXK93531.1 Na(+)/H(+) antiporter subunit B [Neoehrlichia mikurensis]UTO55513.1 Na(+)/H(+) antiporter subunit B [Neoehrlichia mikurensis]UTO56434.1 Na(+)/H(+) antiporter subunit B [Neoehrlichia mikurensis]